MDIKSLLKKGSKRNDKKTKKKPDTLDEDEDTNGTHTINNNSVNEEIPEKETKEKKVLSRKRNIFRFRKPQSKIVKHVERDKDREVTKEHSKETLKEPPKELAKEASREVAKEVTKEVSKEVHREVAKVKSAPSAHEISLKKFLDDVKMMRRDDKTFGPYFDSKLAPYTPPKTEATVWAENGPRNRSKTIPCYDHSRVKIEEDPANKSGYIHANMIEIEDFSRKYILTQFPLQNTMEDFWTMVFEKQVETILSVFNPLGDPDIPDMKQRKEKLAAEKSGTATSERSEPKTLSQREAVFEMKEKHLEIALKSQRCSVEQCTSYFPIDEGQYMTIGRYFVHTRKVERPDRVDRPTIYTIEVLPEGCSECRFVRVANLATWEARGLPPSYKALLSLIRAISLDPLQKGPIVVHCDLGVDRSAAIVFTDVIITRLLSAKPVDVEDLFKQLRNSRAQCFQQSTLFGHSIFVTLVYCYLRFKSGTRGQISGTTMSQLKGVLIEMKHTQPKQQEETTGGGKDMSMMN